MAGTEPTRIEEGLPRLPQNILDNLYASGLTDETIETAGIRTAMTSELPSNFTGATGYVIPFHNTSGERVPFTRTRVMHPNADIKYYQPPNTGQRIYLPPNVPIEVWHNPEIPLVAVEGEKKAMKLAQEGIPCFGVTGVFSWRQRTYQFKKERVREQTEKTVTITFTNESDLHMQEQVPEELLEIILPDRKIWLVFDTDEIFNDKVQLAVFEFAMFMDERGAIPAQVLLPRLDGEKTGPDDFLVKREDAVGLACAKAEFMALLNGHNSFPTAPNLIAWIQRMRNGAKGSKANIAPKIARAIIANLDTHGRRYCNKDSGEFYYLSESDRFGKGLHTFTLTDRSIRDQRNIAFGKLMIKGHRIGTHEKEILSEVADLYATCEPIEEARPRRVCYSEGDAFYFQANDVTNLRVTADGIEETQNGREMLFYGNTVKPLNIERFYSHLTLGIQGLWMEALKDFEIQPLFGLNKRQTRLLLAAIFHLNPWLRHWRGLMEPIEQAIAEAGSGKTFLYQLRRGILTGKPSLDAIGGEMRDWIAAITNAPGIWIGDNINEVPKDMRDELQNAIARLVTDTDPGIDARALYSDNRQVRFPLDCSFAITAIRSPFNKPDIIQRSFMYRLRTIPQGKRNGSWVEEQLADRERWVAEHLSVIQGFFREVNVKWDTSYRSSHRLVHFEQSLLLMMQVLGSTEEQARFIIDQMPLMINEDIAQNDPLIEALRDFAEYWWTKSPGVPCRAQDIVNWASNDADGTYSKVYQLGSAISIGRWLKNNATVVELSAGLKMIQQQNQTLWTAIDPKLRGRPTDDATQSND